MPTFRYTAVDSTGRPVSDTVIATDETAARQDLSSLGFTDIAVDGLAASASESGSSERRPRRPEAVELTEADFMAVGQNLADMAAAGKPLSGGLRALSEEAHSRRLRKGLRQIADRIDSGMPLDEIFSKRITGFPPHVAGLIRAGLKAGCLDRVLQQSLTYSMRANTLRRRVKFSMAYPLMLLAMVAVLMSFIMVYIMPMFTQIFYDFGTELPGMTMLMVRLSEFLVRYGLWLLLGGVVLAGVLWMAARLLLGRPHLRRLICGIPLFGGVLRNSALMEYCHLLAVLIDSRMALPEALRHAAGGVHDADLADASRRLADAVAQGQPFAWTAAATRPFPAVFCQFVKWGERHQKYPEALHAAGDIFEGRARVQASLLMWLIEPIVIIAAGLVIGGMIIAMFLPLIKLLNDLT